MTVSQAMPGAATRQASMHDRPHARRVPKVMLPLLILVALLCGAGEALASKPRTVLVFGDSLSAAYGMAGDQGWVGLLQPRLAERGWRVVNASMSGETTAGGLSRLPLALEEHRPDVVLIELGANDALRGLPLDLLERNLRRMTSLSREQGAEVLIIGMRMPPNFGQEYTTRFTEVFRRVAESERTALLPFLLEPVAESRELFQADQIHPTAAAQPRIAEHVWSMLDALTAAEAAASP